MTEDTAPVALFQIRDFPVELREAIVREAKANDRTVGDFMTAVCTVARANGWLRTAANTAIHTVIQPVSSAGSPAPAGTTAAAVATLVDAACHLAAAKGLRRHVRAAAEAAIVQGLDIYVGLALPPRRPAISPPEESP